MFQKQYLQTHLDFSENYSTFYQQEISSAHWMKNLITVHPFVVFYKCPDCGDGAKPVSDVLDFVTDDTTTTTTILYEGLSIIHINVKCVEK